MEILYSNELGNRTITIKEMKNYKVLDKFNCDSDEEAREMISKLREMYPSCNVVEFRY